jgi:hypothetical protein
MRSTLKPPPMAALMRFHVGQVGDDATGSYPWTDSWGNKTCKRYGDGGTATVETRPGQSCPTGSFPTVDSWGNKVCREQGAGARPATDYYDTSKGCPTGTHPWADAWGNKVCKRF